MCGVGLRLQFATSSFAGLLFEVTICDLKNWQQFGQAQQAGEGARPTFHTILTSKDYVTLTSV